MLMRFAEYIYIATMLVGPLVTSNPESIKIVTLKSDRDLITKLIYLFFKDKKLEEDHEFNPEFVGLSLKDLLGDAMTVDTGEEDDMKLYFLEIAGLKRHARRRRFVIWLRSEGVLNMLESELQTCMMYINTDSVDDEVVEQLQVVRDIANRFFEYFKDKPVAVLPHLARLKKASESACKRCPGTSQELYRIVTPGRQ